MFSNLADLPHLDWSVKVIICKLFCFVLFHPLQQLEKRIWEDRGYQLLLEWLWRLDIFKVATRINFPMRGTEEALPHHITPTSTFPWPGPASV